VVGPFAINLPIIMWKLGDVLQQESFGIYTKHNARLFVQKQMW
jgi:hypothetical protein